MLGRPTPASGVYRVLSERDVDLRRAVLLFPQIGLDESTDIFTDAHAEFLGVTLDPLLQLAGHEKLQSFF